MTPSNCGADLSQLKTPIWSTVSESKEEEIEKKKNKKNARKNTKKGKNIHDVHSPYQRIEPKSMFIRLISVLSLNQCSFTLSAY